MGPLDGHKNFPLWETGGTKFTFGPAGKKRSFFRFYHILLLETPFCSWRFFIQNDVGTGFDHRAPGPIHRAPVRRRSNSPRGQGRNLVSHSRAHPPGSRSSRLDTHRYGYDWVHYWLGYIKSRAIKLNFLRSLAPLFLRNFWVFLEFLNKLAGKFD